MNTAKPLAICAAVLMSCFSGLAPADQGPVPYVRLAELEIEASQMDIFKAAVSEGIETAIRIEPGVLVLYAVFEKENPNHVRVFEMYTDANAYKTHLETPHFQKFRAATDKIVISRKLLDAVPIALGAKEK